MMVKKTANEKLFGSKDLPKLVDLREKPDAMKRLKGRIMLVASPLQYNQLMAEVPVGKVLTIDRMREYLAQEAAADVTCPMTAGIFTNICAHASQERETDQIPWWRTLKKAGELNDKYPGGIEEQKRLLEMEGHSVQKKGKRLFVEINKVTLYDLTM